MLVALLLPARPASTTAPARKPPAEHRGAALLDEPPAPEELALLRRERSFDQVTQVRAEDEREANVLRDMAMAQLKKDDEIMKKWIAMI